jgi:hypothetical protein
MSEDRDGHLSIPLPLALSGGGFALGCLLVGVTLYLLLAPGPAGREPASPTLPPVNRTLVFPTATVAPADEPSPTAETQQEPTALPAEQSTPTTGAEPEATDTPAPTDQPATNPPNPTDTPPPTATPTESSSSSPVSGLTNVKFWVDNPVVGANERISFNFSVTNGGFEDITFGLLGVVVLDAAGNNVHFHTSWTQWILEPGKTVNWNDGVAIGTPGTYQLRLSACVSHIDRCNAGTGEWMYLADPVSITVN